MARKFSQHKNARPIGERSYAAFNKAIAEIANDPVQQEAIAKFRREHPDSFVARPVTRYRSDDNAPGLADPLFQIAREANNPQQKTSSQE